MPSRLAAALLALAHALKVFAAAEGATVTGRVYTADGTGAAGVPVSVGVGGAPVAELTTDADGRFRFRAEVRADHQLRAVIDGHAASWTLRAAELPAALPAPAGKGVEDRPPPAPTAPAAVPVPANAKLEALIEQAVARQVSPLRADLQAWQAETRWRDVVGGLGWIVGLFGLAAWASARRRKERGD